jgi:ABC-type multidrug transport system ATPase subunit
MSETVLNALVQLFALIGDIHDDTVITSREKDIVKAFLSRLLNNELVERYMKLFDEYLALYNSERISKGSIQDRKRTSLNAMRILAICEKINEELQQAQKIYVVVQLIDYISSGQEITENKLDFIHTVADAFYVTHAEYDNIRNFIMGIAADVREKDRLLIIDNKNEPEIKNIRHIFNQHLTGTISFLHIISTNTYLLRYSGDQSLYLNGQNIAADQTYIFDHGASIRGSGISTIYYTEVVSLITGEAHERKITLTANDVTFKFRKSENGIHNLNFRESSGKLVGILGGSGVGKSTTLSILNGTLKPQEGKVLINGYDLYDENGKKYLKRIIGFVPQDDLLIEELTVFQNLFYNAKMCLSNLTDEKITEVVNKTLLDLDLYETRDLKVGNPLKKVISGGQRKRVNIALELLREPDILFVDEPTSGLSSVDSEMVMTLLKEQTYRGNLVIINIHQPSSDIYKMFDKIMIIDKGGYQVYYGNPTEAIIYFKTRSNHVNADEDQCIKCGNVDTDQILQIIESKVVNEHGKPTRVRKITPEEWALKFRENLQGTGEKASDEKEDLPDNIYSIPGLFRQSVIFFTRDFLSKIADKQYIMISLIGPPLLALLLAFFTRYTEGTYKMSENGNIPAYLFMCVITSLFFGLMISSEEIVKDQKILKRESFLNLSWFSYLNSKVMILFLVSAIQTLSFVIIGNLILGIKGMTLSYWLVLFTTACSANILGLNISSAFNSVVTIYILIPFIIIPQLLFSGVMVKFDKLNLKSNSTQEFVPVIGDMMTARWSFEAMAVRQFKNNEFEKNFIDNDIESSQNSWYGEFLIDKLDNDLRICNLYYNNPDYSEIVENGFNRLNYHVEQLSGLSGISPGPLKNLLNATNYNPKSEKEIHIYLNSLKRQFISFKKRANAENDSIKNSLESTIGKDELVNLRENHENKKLRFLALDEDNINMTFETPEKFVQKFQPGFRKALSRNGRAHFYAPSKMLWNLEIDTFWFDVIVVWVVSLLLYIALYYKLLQKLIHQIGKFRIQKSET